MTEIDPDEPVTYPLRWPAWMASEAAKAAKTRTTSLAAWLREAVREKLERERRQ
jgi:hypothetical protein